MHPAAPAVLTLLLLLPGLAAAFPECTEATLRVELSPEPREPIAAAFLLVVHPARATRQVQLFFMPLYWISSQHA